MVEFRLLGEIELRIDNAVADIGSVRQRCVLATLLIDANRTVSANLLVERVWAGHRYPNRPTSVLQTYVSLLRKALAPAASATITRHSGGYQLNVDEQAVDLHQFRGLVRLARTGDDADRTARFEQAIGLWRGLPFADLDTPWINAVRATLTNERHAVELDLTDIRLRQGQHAALLAALSDRVATYPLDERLGGQYMTALYRSGRQADALQYYQSLRELLADGLGTDPSPPLQKLYRQILTADLALDAPAAAPRPARLPRPRQLPAPPRLFTGRTAELAALTDMLDAQAGTTMAISAIGGTGGIGKTWLALQWAHLHVDRFPDGQLHVDLRGFDPAGQPMSPATAIRGFLDALGVDTVPTDLNAQVGMYRSLVADKRMLIMLDNAADTAQVTPLLPGSATCVALVTSRRRLTGLLTGHGAHALDLDVLAAAESRELLARYLGADRLAAHPTAVRELLSLCAGLPLAISIIAAHATAHPDFPLSALADALTGQASPLDALDGGDPQTNLRAVLSWSYQALSPDAATVFGPLGLVPGPDIGLHAAASLTALDPGRTSTLLRELENAYLLQQPNPGRYRMHDLVRRYAADRADSGADGLRRLVDHYLRTASAGDRLLDRHRPPIELGDAVPGARTETLPDEAAAMAWFTAEHPNLLATQRVAAERHWYAPAWQLAWTTDTFHWRRGHTDGALTAWTTGLAATQEQDDPANQILARRRLGHACAVAGMHAQALAHLYAALTLAESAGDVAAQAHAHHSLAWAWEQQGDDQQALAHSSRALPLYQTLDRPVWQARELNAVGWYSARVGDYEQARAHCAAALALFRRHASRPGEANTLDSLGYIGSQLGHHAEAKEYYAQALDVLHDLGHTYQEAATLDRLGHTHTALGEDGEARTAWQRALALYEAQDRTADADRIRRQLAFS
ncbi:MAG TPA: BTAD domain-containing putative transcriptional regulator [Pseudonocardiaceae bacterium]